MAEYVPICLFLFSLLLMKGGGGRRQETVALLDDSINGGEGDSPLTQREVEKCAQYLEDAQRCKQE